MNAPPTALTQRRRGDALQGKDAGVISRTVAAAIDLAVVVVAVVALYLVVAGFLFMLNPRGFSWPPSVLWSVPFVTVFIAAPYLAIAWAASGRSVGDVFLGLRVLGCSGGLLHPSHAALRAIFCVVFPVGLLWVAVDPARRSIQDRVLATRVTYDWQRGG
jgi:uncharacterized RDD family membrane protein YckC